MPSWRSVLDASTGTTFDTGAMLPAAEAVPPPEAASPPVVHVKVKCVASGTVATAKVPLYPETPILVLVMSWPATKPCAAAVESSR